MRVLFDQADEILLSYIVIGELRAGFRNGNQPSQNEAELQRFMSMPKVTVVSVTDTTTHTYAAVYAQLRRDATPVSPNDLWIAAQAIECGATLLTTDNDFRQVSGLDVTVVKPR